MKRLRLSLILFAMILASFFVARSSAAAQLYVTVSTDNQTYGPGQLISISGQVLDESLKGVQSASVSIQANDPSGNPIHVAWVFSSANGSYTDQFTSPSNPANGGYTVYVTASKPGYTDASNQVVCAITPEFPISHAQWLALLSAVLVLLLARRRDRRGASQV